MRRIVLITCVGFILVNLLGCSKESSITILAMGPLTGDGAIWGRPMKDGIDLAVEDINRSGGVEGRGVKVIWEDDKCDASTGLTAFQNEVARSDVSFLVGVNCSSVALALIPEIQRRKIVFISAGASNPTLSGCSKYFFRNYPSDLFEATTMANVAYSRLKLRRIAVLYGNHQYGVGLFESFKKEFLMLGGQICDAETFSQGADDYRSQLVRISKSKPEAIYIPNYPDEIGKILKQARELGITTQFLGNSGVNEREVLKIAGNAANGVIYTYAGLDISANSDPVFQSFLKEYRTRFNEDPGIISPNGYDAIMMLCEAIRSCGQDPDKVVEQLRAMRGYHGVSGIITFDKNGDVEPKYRLMVVKNQRFDNY
jgi:branched-chain amino acid transport system substrate-binding protein